jgi:hypothetical protein
MVTFPPLSQNRDRSITLNPPDSDFFLSNMAVDSQFHRQGIASMLLRLCEDLARARGPNQKMYLVARKKDTPAVQLYKCAPPTPFACRRLHHAMPHREEGMPLHCEATSAAVLRLVHERFYLLSVTTGNSPDKYPEYWTSYQECALLRARCIVSEMHGKLTSFAGHCN